MRASRGRLVALAAALALSGCAGGLLGAKGPQARTGDQAWWVASGVRMYRQHERWDCGPAALATLLSRWRGPSADATQVDVREELARNHGPGVKAGQLRTVTRAMSLQAFLVRGTVDDLAYELAHGRPVLVGLVNYLGKRTVGHYGVVVGLRTDRTRIMLADPARGWRELSLAAFELEWGPAQHLAMVVFPARPGSGLAHSD